MKLFLIKSNKDKHKVAQRVLSFKKKTRLTVTNMHSKLLNSHSVHPPLSDVGGGGVEAPTNYSKRRGWTGPQLLEGVAGKEGTWLYLGGCSFYIKINQNLKYLMTKKLMIKNIFLCQLRIQTGKFQLRM